MRYFILLIFCSGLLLQSCKKDKMQQKGSGELNISGFGAVAFVGGDAISVYGTGFDPDPLKNIVSFNGVKGEVANATPNRLQVIAPLLATSGKLTVTVGGKSVTSADSYAIVNLLQGTYNDNFIMTPDKKYLLRGNVVFNSKLIILPGTVIYGEKLTRGSLSARDIDIEGTPDKPIIFTSDQAPGKRNPGDWRGIRIGAPSASGVVLPNGIMKYVRVEYAGYHNSNELGAALRLTMVSSCIYQYMQASYSAGMGMFLSGNDGSFIDHIIAFGCMGDDFRFTGTGITSQFGLGIKDPYLASDQKSNGISFVDNSSSQGQLGIGGLISNYTLVGYNPDARNILNIGETITNNAGSGIMVGTGLDSLGVPALKFSTANVYNSLVLAGWQSGATVTGGNGVMWNNFDNGTIQASSIRNNFFAGTSAKSLPKRGGVLGRLSEQTAYPKYLDISTDTRLAHFGSVNDTTKVLSFSKGIDDLGIKNLVDYSRINNPVLLPAAGSVLLKSASFPLGSPADNPFVDKTIHFMGAFGTSDWTLPWANFNPQIARY